MNRNKKIIIGILIAVLMSICVIGAYKIIEKSATDRENLKLEFVIGDVIYEKKKNYYNNCNMLCNFIRCYNIFNSQI